MEVGLGLKEGTVENMDDDREERGLNFEEKIFEMKDEGPTEHNACVDKGGGCCIVGCSYGPKGEMDVNLETSPVICLEHPLPMYHFFLVVLMRFCHKT